jgi:hypothetical protein
VTGLPVRLSPNHLLGTVASELSADPEITSPLEFGVPFLDFALSEQAKMAHIVSVDHFSGSVIRTFQGSYYGSTWAPNRSEVRTEPSDCGTGQNVALNFAGLLQLPIVGKSCSAELPHVYGTGIVMVLPSKVTAPIRANARPSSVAPVVSVMD